MSKTIAYYEKPTHNAMLFVFTKNGVKKYQIGNFCSIGRFTQNGTTPDVPIASHIVSRKHGEISVVRGKYYYRDCNSTNGTYINNRFIGKNSADGKSASEINNGDILGFDLIQNGKHHSERVIAIFTTTVSEDIKWSKVNLNNEIVGIDIGRSVEHGLKIDNQMFSEKHASFFSSKNGWTVIDHNSKNGVLLNNKKITSPEHLNEFDVVRIVDTFFVFFEEAIIFCNNFIESNNKNNNNLACLSINIIERSVMQRFKKMMLLQDINLSVSAGEMVLILGGSGAGKTTFINAVMGYEKASGKITYNNTDIYEEYEQMKYEIGFVPQQDLLRGSDTVYDTLSNAAEMKLPRKYSAEEREERICNVLEELGLSREKETLVSKLSGGQRKRLSIAVEFIADPALFFLDEPDSGLDDVMGRGLMENLRSIANNGKIIMVITHSPERAADLFDKVIVLAKSSKDNCGHLAFYGSTREALDFFEVSSFRGIVKKINRPDENGEGLADYFIDKYSKYKN